MDVAWSLPALGDLDQIQDYIAQDSPVAAHRLILRLFEAVDDLLPDNPMAGRIGRVTGTRELVVTGTPYIVVYRIKARIEILAVVHGSKLWPASFT